MYSLSSKEADVHSVLTKHLYHYLKKIVFQRRTFGVGAKLGGVVGKAMRLTDSLQRNKAEEIRQSFPLMFLCFQLKGLQFQGFQFLKIRMPNMFKALLSPRRTAKII